jgi:hypothetical protein
MLQLVTSAEWIWRPMTMFPSPPITDGALVAPSQPPPHVTRLARQRRPHGGGKWLPQSLQQAEYVYFRRGYCSKPLAPVYSGPYKVLNRSPKYFILQVGGEDLSYSVDRLKPHMGTSPVSPAQPPRRGRPAATSSSALIPDGWGLGGAPVAAAMRHLPPEKIRHLLLINAPVFYRLK